MIARFGYGRMMGGIHPGGGFELFGVVLFLVLAAVAVALVIWALRHRPGCRHALMATPPAPQAPSAVDSARQIARERLARGEIDPEQYRAIVDALGT